MTGCWLAKLIIILINLTYGIGIFLTTSYGQVQTHWRTAVFEEVVWRYFPGVSEPPFSWPLPTFVDTLWSSGSGGIGYGDGDDRTVIAPVSALYLRHSFLVSDPSIIREAVLHMDADDGFIAYLNGVEIARTGLTGYRPAHRTFAADQEAVMYQGQLPPAFFVSADSLSKALQPGINVLAIQVHNSSATSSDLSARPWLSFLVDQPFMIYTLPPTWFDLRPPEVFKSKLPLIEIFTPGQQPIPDNDQKMTAWMRLVDNGINKINYSSDSAFYSGFIGIEIRGASSAEYPQKSFNVETRDDSGNNRNVSLLGLPKENDWVLVTNYNDKTLLRNTLTHHLFQQMGHYAPRTRHVEIFINGQYQGLYLWSEKIKRDDGRVDLAKPDPMATSGDKLTGGYIFKNDNRDPDEKYILSLYNETGQPGQGGINFIFVDPSSDEITPAQSQYLQDYLHQLEEALYGLKFKDPVHGYRAYLEVSSFIDYFIIGEVSRSVDAYKKSKFFYKDADSQGGKLHSGPTWDFDWAYKNIPEGDPAQQCYYGVTDGSGWAYRAMYCRHRPPFPGWILRLLQDDYFTGLLKQRYQSLRQSILSDAYLAHFIDSMHTTFAEAIPRHFSRWPVLGKVTLGSPEVDPQPATYREALDQLKKWLTLRLSWLDKHLPALHHTPDQTKFNIRIYPNPARRQWQLESSYELARIEIYDHVGRLLKILRASGQIISMEAGQLTPGIYMLKIFTATGEFVTHKLVLTSY